MQIKGLQRSQLCTHQGEERGRIRKSNVGSLKTVLFSLHKCWKWQGVGVKYENPLNLDVIVTKLFRVYKIKSKTTNNKYFLFIQCTYLLL